MDLEGVILDTEETVADEVSSETEEMLEKFSDAD